ncbi:MAG: aminotransferase class V-fold PLP-dependent enzyme [Saprospiraceae bacterium]
MLSNQKHLFDLPDYITYLNCAYMSPQLRSVADVGIAAVSRKNLPFTIQPTDFFTEVKAVKTLFAKLIQTPESERISIIPSVSYGLANVANNIPLKPGENILVVEDQFPSNVYLWQRLAEKNQATIRVVAAPSSASRTTAWNEAILEAIDHQTKLVAIGNVHWADGTKFDLMAIRQKTNEVGALLVIDGTQSVGALPINVAELQPDALICAGYKWLFGPYSIGVGYYGPYFDNGVPIEENWINRLNSEDFRGLVNYQALYQPGAGRYSVGEQSNFILLPMLKAALEQILAWGVDNIQSYTKNLSQAPLEILREMGCQIEAEAQRCGHLFGIRLKEDAFDFRELSQIFTENNIYVSFRGNSIRVAPHVYNDVNDFTQLTKCFAKARKKTFI